MKPIYYLLSVLLLAGMVLQGCEKDDKDEPRACFEIETTEILENQPVEFVNCSENATAYYWDFGDGSTSVEYHESHRFAEPGTYEVSLEVFRDDMSDKVTQELVVAEDPSPVACFTVESTSVSVGEEVLFENCSENALEYHWDFGDGNTSEEEHPVHAFDVAGEMEVVLTASNDAGQDSMSKTIQVAGEDVVFFEGFEAYDDFALEFGDWEQIDNDGSTTWGLAATSFPNSGYVGSFIIFNPYETDPPVHDDDRFVPYNGQKYAACFAAQNPPNDDWMISPEITLGEDYALSLAIKSYSDSYGPDLFVIQLLDGDETIWLSPENNPVNPPLEWNVYSYDLSEYAGREVRIQIGCVSDDSVAMFIDDIMVTSGDGRKVYHQNFETEKSWQAPFPTPGKRK